MRTAIALILAAMTLALPSGGPDRRFRDSMVPVTLADGSMLNVARYEVTIAEWRACFGDGGCAHLPAPSTARGDLPVTGVNWFDVAEYLAWANAKAGGGLRLPFIEEWREIARSLAHEKPAPRFADPRLSWAANYGQESAPPGPPRRIGSFTTTPDMISDLDGNVWEWTSSCAASGFAGRDAGRCPAYVAAGAHEAPVSVFIRDPATGGCSSGTPPAHLGFRLVADIPQEDRI